MRHESPKRAKQNRLYRKLRVGFLADHPACEGCGAAADQVHHKKGRDGALLLDQDHWAALCGPCHKYVTEHPEWAKQAGLSENRIGAA